MQLSTSAQSVGSPVAFPPAAAGGRQAKRQPPSLKGAFTVGTVSLMLYLFIVHSFKLEAASVVLSVGLLGVCMFVRPLRIAPSLWWFAAFLLWALVTLPLSQFPVEAWATWVISFKLWLIIFLAYNAIQTPGQLRLIMLTWLVVFAMYPVRGTILNFLFGYSTFGRYAWNFTFSNFNDLSAYTLIPLGFAVDRLRSAESKWVKLGALGGLVLLPFITLLTQSRGGMLGTAVFFGYLIVRSKQRVRMMVALSAVGLVALMFAPQAVWDRINGMKYLSSTKTLSQSDVSAEQRFVIMKVAVAVAASNPVFGVGIGAYPATHRLFARTRPEWSLARGTKDSHNTYLKVLTETGIVGFGLFGMFFLTSYNELRKKVRELKGSTDPADKELSDRCQAFQAAFAGLSVCAIFGSLNQVAFVFLLAIMGSAMVRFPRTSTSAVAAGPAQMANAARPRFRGGLGVQRRAVAR